MRSAGSRPSTVPTGVSRGKPTHQQGASNAGATAITKSAKDDEGKAAKASQGAGVLAMTTWGAHLRGAPPPSSGGALPVATLLASHDNGKTPVIGGGAGGKTGTSTLGSLHHMNGTSGGSSLTAAYNRGEVGMRKLDDYFSSFPVDRPAVAKPLQLQPNDGSHGQGGNANGRESPIEAEMKNAEQEIQSRRQAKETAQKSYDALRRHKVDQWTQLAEKHNKKLKKENEMLSRIAEITQQAALDNDTRYEEAVASLKAQVEFTGLYRSSDGETMTYVREAIADIQDRLAQIQQASEREVQSELANIRSGFEAQVQLRTEELIQARAAGQSTTEQWVQESRALQAELEKLLLATDTAHGRHKQLARRHQRLRIENEAQQDDAALLARQWTLVSSQHNRLKDRVQELDLEIASARQARESGIDLSSTAGASPNDSTLPASYGGAGVDDGSKNGESPGRASAAGVDDQHAKRLALALHRAQALLASEQQSLAAVRKAHLAALQQRTELEVYLRCAVLRHQQRLVTQHYADREGRRATSEGYALAGTASSNAKVHPLATSDATHSIISSTSFTADDRRLVIESLLSIPRVLQLMYRNGAVAAGGAESSRDKMSTVRSDLIAIGASPAHVAAAAASLTDPDAEHDALSSSRSAAVGRGSAGVTELDERGLEQLWERWQQWTTNANTAYTAVERAQQANNSVLARM